MNVQMKMPCVRVKSPGLVALVAQVADDLAIKTMGSKSVREICTLDRRSCEGTQAQLPALSSRLLGPLEEAEATGCKLFGLTLGLLPGKVGGKPLPPRGGRGSRR